MNWILILITMTTLFATPAFGAAKRGQNQGLNEIRNSLDDVRYELMNQEMLLRTFEEKFSNQESIVESLAQQLDADKRSNRDLLKGNHTTLDGRLKGIEKILKGLADDVRSLQQHANKTTVALTQSQTRLDQIEQITDNQSSDMDNMKAAITALMDALGGVSPEKIYTVKYGDTLGVIAQHNQTTVQVLKKMNHLKNDTIKEGQKLNLP